MKTQATGWQKIFTNHKSYKGLVSKIYKKFLKPKFKKKTAWAFY